MNISIECSGEQATSSPAKIAVRAQAVPIPSSVRQALIASEVSNLENSATWKVPSIPAVNHTYFHSTIPTPLASDSATQFEHDTGLALEEPDLGR